MHVKGQQYLNNLTVYNTYNALFIKLIKEYKHEIKLYINYKLHCNLIKKLNNLKTVRLLILNKLQKICIATKNIINSQCYKVNKSLY